MGALVLLVNSLRLDINGQKEVKIKGSEIQDRFFIKPFLEILSNDDEDYNDKIIDSDETGWINDWSEVFNVENFGVLQEVSEEATDKVEVAGPLTDDGVTIPPWKYSWIFGLSNDLDLVGPSSYASEIVTTTELSASEDSSGGMFSWFYDDTLSDDDTLSNDDTLSDDDTFTDEVKITETEDFFSWFFPGETQEEEYDNLQDNITDVVDDETPFTETITTTSTTSSLKSTRTTTTTTITTMTTTTTITTTITTTTTTTESEAHIEIGGDDQIEAVMSTTGMPSTSDDISETCKKETVRTCNQIPWDDCTWVLTKVCKNVKGRVCNPEPKKVCELVGIYTCKMVEVCSYSCQEKKNELENGSGVDDASNNNTTSCEPQCIRKPHCATKDSVNCREVIDKDCSSDNTKKCTLVPERKCKSRSKLHCEDLIQTLC